MIKYLYFAAELLICAVFCYTMHYLQVPLWVLLTVLGILFGIHVIVKRRNNGV